MVITVPPDQPLTYTRRPIFVSASVHINQNYEHISRDNWLPGRHSNRISPECKSRALPLKCLTINTSLFFDVLGYIHTKIWDSNTKDSL
jgi:hypothetical protein